MKGSILLVDDEPNILKTVTIALEAAGYAVTAYLNPLQAVEAMREHVFDLAFFDLKMQPIDGLQLLREARRLSPETTAIIMTAHGSVDSAVEAMKLGAHDYLEKPFEFTELRHFVERVYEYHRLRREVRQLREELDRYEGMGEIVTRSERMKGVMSLAMQVAPSGIAVLIEGESGTGKELLAHLIHQKSPRQENAFIPVNCTALAENLLESELFGHVRGAFTGAVKDRQGRFEVADGGTVFLDEVGEIPPSVQVKLLRFLQSKEFERVGESATRRVDVRVLAATNRDLEAAVERGAFREDLFYRLNAVRLKIPPPARAGGGYPPPCPAFPQEVRKRLRGFGRGVAGAAGVCLEGERAGAGERDRAGGDPCQGWTNRAPASAGGVPEYRRAGETLSVARTDGAAAHHPRVAHRARPGRGSAHPGDRSRHALAQKEEIQPVVPRVLKSEHRLARSPGGTLSPAFCTML